MLYYLAMWFRKKPKPWFKKVRWSYLPVSSQGWLTYIPYVTYLIIVFLAVDRSAHSASDTIIGVFPYWIAGAVVMHWLASHKS